MIVDLERDKPPEFSAEVLIVGAGAAGLTLATELVRLGRRVLLLESGGETVEPAAQELNEAAYTGQPHRGANIGRVRVLGGTTTLWGGQVLELAEEDFAARPWVPGSGWPFRKEELAPWYRKALALEGLSDAESNDGELWRKMGVGSPELGQDLLPYFTRWCPEPNFARLTSDALRSPRLLALLHATAAAITLTENGARVAGIRCQMPSGKQHVFHAEHYVLALGTIETVRLLLQPMAGGHTSPWNRSGLLGRHFQSHIDRNVSAISPGTAAHLAPWFANVYRRGHKYHPKFRLSPGAQQAEKILSIAASISAIHPAEVELRQAKALVRNLVRGRMDLRSGRPAAILRQLPAMLRIGYGYGVRGRSAWPKSSSFWLRIHCEQEPLSASSIALTGERDASGLLRARLDWRISTEEWKTIRRFTEIVGHAFLARGWTGLAPQPELAGVRGYENLVFDDSHHHMGGSRMASNPLDGVVDPDLQLHENANASVCSASVFPSSGFSNPTHTLIALALRLADCLNRKVPPR